MKARDLADEVGYHLSQMEIDVRELEALRRDVGKNEPTLREVMAAGAFLGSFYNGVENILKRVSKHYGVTLPEGEHWHIALVDSFRQSSASGLPVLLTEQLVNDLDVYRRFRHIARSTYGMELDWTKVVVGIDGIASVFDRLRAAVFAHLLDLGEAPPYGPDVAPTR